MRKEIFEDQIFNFKNSDPVTAGTPAKCKSPITPRHPKVNFIVDVLNLFSYIFLVPFKIKENVVNGEYCMISSIPRKVIQ